MARPWPFACLAMLQRLLLLTLLPLWLSACGNADQAVSAKPAAAAPVVQAPVVVPEKVVPAAPVAPAEPTPPAAEPQADQAAKQKAKSPTRVAEQGKATAAKPQAVAKAKSRAAAEVHKVTPHSKLDMRLPKEVLHGLEPGSSELAAEIDKPLLPPMFEEKPKESPFQMGGRLIQRERNERSDPSDDSWHSDIRGAELQFQFRN